MRITTKAIYDMNNGKLIAWEGFEYVGPLEMAGGGPSKAQQAAAASQTNLTNKLADTADREEAFKEKQQDYVNPFFLQRLKFGDPNIPTLTDYAGPTNAAAYAPARANILRQFSKSALPSGSKDAILANFENERAHGFDQSLSGLLDANEKAKQAAASGLLGQAQIADPVAYYQGALSGNSSIMNANLRKPGIAGTVGALTGGALAAFA